ncbi:MAG: hypothetical protein GY925_03940 [Actinomycetia bacterium]|nr:hypothetical protein [Actinomycetes bacterium]
MTRITDTVKKRRWLGRTTRAAALLVALFVGLLIAAKVVIEVRDRADPVDVEVLAEQFDDTTSATDIPVTPTEADGNGPITLVTGVWSMDAEGSEDVDILGGPVHEFPPQAAHTVSNTECGQDLTVDLFEQRSDVLELCRDGDALMMSRFITRHEFIGVKDETTTKDCEPIRIIWPDMVDSVGEPPVTVDCTAVGSNAGELSATLTLEIVGTETVDVGGRAVDAVRFKFTSVVGTQDDPTHGTYDTEMWLSIDDSVIVRRTLAADVTASTPLGAVSFRETFDLNAWSLDPIGS